MYTIYVHYTCKLHMYVIYVSRLCVSIDMSEVASRVIRYLTNANQVIQLPLAEAILTNKDKG